MYFPEMVTAVPHVNVPATGSRIVSALAAEFIFVCVSLALPSLSSVAAQTSIGKSRMASNSLIST
jgi:hypothetical protein